MLLIPLLKEVGTINSRRKLRHREVQSLAQGHTASERWRFSSNPGSLMADSPTRNHTLVSPRPIATWFACLLTHCNDILPFTYFLSHFFASFCPQLLLSNKHICLFVSFRCLSHSLEYKLNESRDFFFLICSLACAQCLGINRSAVVFIE